jgi:hypothetical protein
MKTSVVPLLILPGAAGPTPIAVAQSLGRFTVTGNPAIAATLGAWGLAFDNSGNLYVADPWNAVIRVLKPQ